MSLQVSLPKNALFEQKNRLKVSVNNKNVFLNINFLYKLIFNRKLLGKILYDS